MIVGGLKVWALGDFFLVLLARRIGFWLFANLLKSTRKTYEK